MTLACIAGAVVLAAVLDLHGVSTSLTEDDRLYIPRYLEGIPRVHSQDRRSLDDEVSFIQAVQRAVQQVASTDIGLPRGHEREPKDLLQARAGLCYDRSRVIEKILEYAGLRTRHVAIYAVAPARSALTALLTPGTQSHAVTEVLTREGWLIVDSGGPWISLDAAGKPVGIALICSRAASGTSIKWKAPTPNPIYERPFTFVYGLYSRHGGFYPPYDFIPDINYAEFATNLW